MGARLHAWALAEPTQPGASAALQVRVVGGAYGGFCSFDPHSGNFAYLSYRDPNLLETLEAYDASPNYLKTLELTQEELTKVRMPHVYVCVRVCVRVRVCLCRTCVPTRVWCVPAQGVWRVSSWDAWRPWGCLCHLRAPANGHWKRISSSGIALALLHCPPTPAILLCCTRALCMHTSVHTPQCRQTQ